jgi:two-component system NtrC family sensor kinase
MPHSSQAPRGRQNAGLARPAMRWLLLLATAVLLLPAGPTGSDPTVLALLAAFAAGNTALLIVPEGVKRRPGFDHVLVIADTVLVAMGLFHADLDGGRFAVVFFLTLFMAGLGLDLTRLAAGATLVAGLYLYLLARSDWPLDPWALWSRVPFLYVVALHYGLLASGVRERDQRQRRTEREKEDLAALVDITAATTSTLDLQRILYVISQRVALLVNAMRCSILQVDEGRRLCRVIASSDNPDLRDLPLDLSKYPEVRRAIETRRPVVIHDVAHEEMMEGIAPLIRQLGFESILVLPLLHGEDLLGMLFLRASRESRRFTEEEIASCQVVANASANALRNAMLYDQVSQEARVRRETTRQLQNVLDHYPDLICTADRDGRVTEFSRGGDALAGLTREAALGARLDDLFPEPEARARLGRLLRDGDLIKGFETVVRHADGTLRDVLLAATVLRSDAGSPQGAVVIAQNISELKEARSHLVQAEKLTALGEVVSGVAHELNNPLAGVLGYAQLLMRGPMEARQQRSVERILDAALRCQKIVQNLLAFSRRSPSEKRALGLNGLVEKVLDLKEDDLRGARIEVMRDLVPDLPKTLLDFNQIQQVLLNLISNAQYAMTRHRGSGRLAVRTRSADGCVQVRVEDDGPGIAREHLARIFDPFFTPKPVGEGTGLGLSISYGIVRDHGGRIWAESDPARGTSLVVEIPVRHDTGARAGEAGGPSGDLEAIGRPLRLLVVDDEPVILDLLVDALAGGRHAVDTAAGGAEAIRKLEKGRYDLLLLDLKMPGLDGRQVFEAIEARWPELRRRVVFASGDTVHLETRAFVARTGRPCVDKPFRLETLTAILAEVAAAAERGAAGDPAGTGAAA